MTEVEILQLPVRDLESGADLRLHLTSERMFTEIPPVESLDRLTKIELALSTLYEKGGVGRWAVS